MYDVVTVTSMLHELEWLTLEERRRVARLVLLYKIIYGVVGVSSSDFLTQSDSCTRNSELTYKHYSAKTEQNRHSYFALTVPEWNKLPIDTRSTESVQTFKTHLKSSTLVFWEIQQLNSASASASASYSHSLEGRGALCCKRGYDLDSHCHFQ